MYLIISKTNCIISGISDNISYLPNGYPLLPERNVAFATDEFETIEVEAIPTDVIEEKYCYEPSKGFFLNKDYSEPNPYGLTEMIYTRIIDDYTDELIEMGVL